MPHKSWRSGFGQNMAFLFSRNLARKIKFLGLQDGGPGAQNSPVCGRFWRPLGSLRKTGDLGEMAAGPCPFKGAGEIYFWASDHPGQRGLGRFTGPRR
jgi:hypothetical protein